MPFSIIVAYDLKRGIGSNNHLPWHLKADLKRFKEITTRVIDPKKKNAVVMGRKTWQSLPENVRPLPNRLNLVLSHQTDLNLPADVEQFFSLDKVLEELNRRTERIENVFVIGGGQIFAQAINSPDLEKIYVTEVLADFNCEIFFPAIPANFQKVEESETFTEDQLSFKFALYATHL